MAFIPPEELHEYRIVRLLGRGAMGAVYLGHDTVLDRSVAIKFIDAVGPDTVARERFLVEARAIARLTHPNVVAIHRVGEWAGQPYLVAEYLAGRSLAELPLPLPASRVLRIGLDLARGLSAAHRRGVVHRDVKPANAQCDEDGSVKLVDFGIAKILGELPRAAAEPVVPASADPDATLPPTQRSDTPAPVEQTPTAITRTGALLGTPRYMAPEVWRGEQATPRSDIYSVGAVLFELLSGRAPHLATNLAQLRWNVTQTDAPALLSVAPDAPVRLAAVIDRCLTREAEQRFAAGDQLALALEELQRGEATPLAGATQAPYRGLLAFEAEHRHLFFGRAEELGSLLELLRAEPFVVVAGDSGAGKSSLCRAGLLPLIEDGALGEGRKWRTATITPGRKPLEALRTAAAQADVVFIDQLEELITQSEKGEAEEAARLIAQLAQRKAGFRLIAAVRGDFLTRLAALPELSAVLTRGLFLLGPLSRAGLRDAIAGPARRSGVQFESDALIDELVASEGSLPLLQFALTKLWEHRDAARGVIPASAVQAIGGVSGALARHADAVVERLLPDERRAARRILTSLVTAQHTRAQRPSAELVLDEKTDAPVLEALVRGRLLTARKSDDDTIYELAHEALLDGWGALKEWLTQDGERRLLQQRVEAAAAEWARLGEARDALWRTKQLAEAQLVQEITPRARKFLAASRKQVRRQRLLRASVPAAILLAIAGVLLTERAQRSREVGVRLTRAQQALEEAQRTSAAVDKARKEAFALFDARDAAQGEARYADATALAEQLRASYAKLERDLESAFFLQVRTSEVRALFAQAIYDELLAAERDRPGAPRDELLQRLASFDETGEFLKGLEAPATLAVSTVPDGATLTARRSDQYKFGAPLQLGKTPWAGTLAPGSWLLELNGVRYPVLLARGERLALDVKLAAKTPPGMIYVPAGRFLYGAGENEEYRRSVLQTVQPQHEVRTGAYFIGRHEVTYGEWLEFVRALPKAQRKARLPAVAVAPGELRLTEIADAKFQLMLKPTQQAFTLREGDKLHYPERDRRVEQDWLRMPVSAVTLDDIALYLKWLGARIPGARLCTEYEWERAARGADDRMYPHGNRLEPDDANHDLTYGRKPLAFGPDEVGAHPASDSPFGVEDLAGNVWEWVTSVASPSEVVYRGGAWYHRVQDARSSNREVGEPTMRDLLLGFRVCANAQ